MTTDQRMIRCMTCPNAGKPHRGVSLCKLSRRPTSTHIDAGDCPAGYYRSGIGDFIARLARRLGLERVAQRRPCGCQRRRDQANGRWAGIVAWAREWRELAK